MRVHFRFVVLEGDIANAGKDLHLLADLDPFVRFGLPIEVTQNHTGERADRGEMAGGEMSLLCESSQPGCHLVGGLEDDGERLGSPRVENFRFQASLLIALAISHAPATAPAILASVRIPVRMEHGST